MKYCPMCDERFDEEIIRFCTKDGTPLIEEDQPNFTALPSESPDDPDDDFGHETVIRRNSPRPAGEDAPSSGQPERIVIPTTPMPEQQVRPRQTAAYHPPPPPQANTGKTVVLTILGTLVVLSFGAGLFWLLQPEPPTNININTAPPDQNLNLNANLGFDSNFNFNSNANFDSNFNVNFNALNNLNANMRTPSPTPTSTPRPSPSPTEEDLDTPTPSPSRTPARPSPSPTERVGPRPPSPSPTASRPANRSSGDD